MQCQNPLDDIEDLAFGLFEFPSEEEQKAKRDRTLKRQNKKVKPQKDIKTTPETHQHQQENDEVDFNIAVEQKPLGTHSIYVKTYGCSHNISDSEFMIGQLVDYGYHMVNSVEEADLVLINSCTVKNPSQDAFLSMVCKAKKIKKPIVVAGCVPQGDQDIPELSEVSALGVTQIDKVVHVVEETLKGHRIQIMSKKELPSLDLPKVRKNKDIEIIPINAGCLGACTYCKTVFARGRLLSYAPQAIVSRLKTVVPQVKEIWLTSEDTGAYGRDIGSNISQLLISLCQQLNNHEGIMMRIGMTNPPYMLQHLKSIAHFLNHPRVFSFIHVPVQAGHNNVLAKMNRQYTVEEFKRVCDFFLEHVPDVTIATDIICGFPQETEEEFQGTMQLINDYKFKVVNINQFYLRPGTPAANLKQIATKVVKQRSTRLTQMFKTFDKFGYMVGKEERVWINEVQSHKGEKILVGHTKNYTKVIFPFDNDLLYKQVIIKVTKAFDWHIEGQIINSDPEPIKTDEDYVKKMKEDIRTQKLQIQQKNKQKIIKLRQMKDKITKKQKVQQKPINKQFELKKQNVIKVQKKQEIMVQKVQKSNYSFLYLAIILFFIGLTLRINDY